jgi:hypothetical protein
LSRYIVFEGAPHYHVLEDEDETACGVMVAAVSTLATRPPKVTASKPHGLLPCGRCLKAPDGPPETSGGPGRTGDRGPINVGDWVQVVVGPQAGRVGRVAGVIRAKGAADSSAVFKVTFSDGGEAGHVGANLKKVDR